MTTTKRGRIAAGLLATAALASGLYGLRPSPAPPAPVAARLLASGSPGFSAYVTSDTLAIRPGSGPDFGLVDDIQSGNDEQQVTVSGPTASGNFTLAFGGRTTASIPFTATPPGKFGTFSGLPVAVATPVRVAVAVVPSPGFYTHSLHWEVIDGGTVALAGTLDLGSVSGADFSLVNPSGGGNCGFTTLAQAYTPASSTISVRFSVVDNSNANWWDVDAVAIDATAYDDADGSHFTQAGSASATGPGGDNRFWAGSFTRFQGGDQAGMAYAIAPGAMQAALRALSSIGDGNCTCTASDGSDHVPLTVEFTGTMGAEAQAGITSATPGVSVPTHTVGGNVPSITETTHAGTVRDPVPLRGVWIYEAGRTTGAVYRLAGTLTPDATSTYSVSVPDGWMTTASGPLPAATATAANRVGGSMLDPFAATPRTMGVGYNILSDEYYSEALTFSDMASRVTTFPYGSSGFAGNLQLNADLYPTLISPGGSQQIVTMPTGFTQINNPLGNQNAPNGLYTFICTDPGHAWVTPGGDSTTGTGVSAVEAYPDTTAGDVKTMVRNVQSDQSKSRAPKLVFDWNASGPQVTFNGLPALPVTVTNLKVYPPDPSDPTGMTPWVNPPRFHPSFLAKLAGCRSIRVDQAMNTTLANGYADYADVRQDSQLGRADTTRQVVVGVESMRQYTGAAVDNPGSMTILVTTTAPHALFSGAIISFTGCGTATFSDGSSIEVTDGGLNYGVITVLTDTTFVWHAGRPLSGRSGVTMTNVTTGGRVTSTIGTGLSVKDCVDLCNAVGADLWFNTSVCITDECIDAVADLIAANLNPGLKVRPELGDELWNPNFESYAWARVAAFRDLGITNDSATEWTAYRSNQLCKRFEARFAAAGRGADVIYMMPSQDGNLGVTTGLLGYSAAQSPPYRIDEIAIAPYFQSIDANPTIDIASASTYPIGVHQDILDLWIDSATEAFVTPHVRAIAASAYPSAGLTTYEGGSESLPACMTLGNAAGYPDAYPLQHELHRSWRMHRLQLCYMQRLQDSGCSLLTRFYLFAGGLLQSYATYEYYNQPDGTGIPSDDGSGFEVLEPGGPRSQEGGAIKLWNSLVTTSPVLTVTPSSASAADASTTVSITATLANSAAGLAASVSGGGTISTASPSSGAPFTYTPPASGSGTATVTVSDATDSLSRTCVITFSPARTPGKTPIRVDRIRPFRRVRPGAHRSRTRRRRPPEGGDRTCRTDSRPARSRA